MILICTALFECLKHSFLHFLALFSMIFFFTYTIIFLNNIRSTLYINQIKALNISESTSITANHIHMCYSDVKSSTKQRKKDIKGLTINKKEYKISLYTDDTSLVNIGLSEFLI